MTRSLSVLKQTPTMRSLLVPVQILMAHFLSVLAQAVHSLLILVQTLTAHSLSVLVQAAHSLLTLVQTLMIHSLSARNQAQMSVPLLSPDRIQTLHLLFLQSPVLPVSSSSYPALVLYDKFLTFLFSLHSLLFLLLASRPVPSS